MVKLKKPRCKKAQRVLGPGRGLRGKGASFSGETRTLAIKHSKIIPKPYFFKNKLDNDIKGLNIKITMNNIHIVIKHHNITS